jgi:dienelactone hydrolase
MRSKIVAICIFLILGGFISSCTEKHEVHKEEIDYSIDEKIFKGYLAYDKLRKGKRPGVLIVHEWWGLNNHVRRRAEMLAELGYTALAVDMYGEGTQADNFDEAAMFAQEISQNPDTRRKRFMAALDVLKKQETVDENNIAAIGYSFGGNVVLQMALEGIDIDGVVSFHGGLLVTKPEEPGSVRARILILQGEKDWYVTPQMKTGFKTDMDKSETEYKIITYKEAQHGYTNPEAGPLAEKFKGMRIEYNEEADKKSWADMQEFLKTVFYKL